MLKRPQFVSTAHSRRRLLNTSCALRLVTGLAISLGLAGLDTAEMRVGTTWRRWERGEALVFDDSFEHEVRNPGEDPRAVLIVHFPHPQLMPLGTHGAEMGTSCRRTENAP